MFAHSLLSAAITFTTSGIMLSAGDCRHDFCGFQTAEDQPSFLEHRIPPTRLADFNRPQSIFAFAWSRQIAVIEQSGVCRMFQHSAAFSEPVDTQRSQVFDAFDGFPLVGTEGGPWSADRVCHHGHTTGKAPHIT